MLGKWDFGFCFPVVNRNRPFQNVKCVYGYRERKTFRKNLTGPVELLRVEDKSKIPWDSDVVDLLD